MKIWFLLPLAIFVLGATYVSCRIWHILPFNNPIRWTVVALFWLSFAIMVSDFFVLDRISMNFATVLYETGFSWIFVLLYLFMIFLLLDIGRLVHLVPSSFLRSNGYVSLGITLFMVAIFAYGNLQYYKKVKVQLTDSSAKITKPQRIVMASDLHLGYHNRRGEFKKWVDRMNAEHPDLILIAGDIIDNSVRPLIEEGMAEEFHRIDAPVYACIGNHEYFSGNEKARAFFKEAGITLLQDSAVTVGDLCVIGRDDRSNPHRMAIAKLMKQADKSKYTILLDHQPYYLEQAERAGVDFQFSGHTHRGQVFPINLITDAIYEKAHGSHQRGNTKYYISSGLGIWGGKFRIGTQSEYVVMELGKGFTR